MNSSSVFVLSCLGIMAASLQGVAAPANSSVPVWLSSDRQFVLVTSSNSNGLRLLDTGSRRTQRITDQAHTALFASISPDERYACFKAFAGGAQVPVIHDIRLGKRIPLAEPAPLCGTPAASRDGHVAFTVGSDLTVLEPDLEQHHTVKLRERANLMAFSPDGRQLVVAYDHGGLGICGTEDLVVRDLAPGATVASVPHWSPDGETLVFRTANGQVQTLEVSGGALTAHGEGEEPGWLDATTVGFVRHEVVDGEVTATHVVAAPAGRGVERATGTPVFSATGEVAAIVTDGGVAIGSTGSAVSIGYYANHSVHLEGTAVDAGVDEVSNREELDAADADLVKLAGVPYIHQAYDCPDGFNGKSACGATSSIMAMQFTNTLPAHKISCAHPQRHSSDYGWYISSTYTFNGHTFDIASNDPSGNVGHGGFGYITQHHWENTKQHMAEFISAHGKTSTADFNMTFDLAKPEIDASHPFVVLTSLTKSGHYICCIGYSKTKQSLVFNDPWGDKNKAYPSTQGAGVVYDWPGQNNGHASLNTVWCFVYCR